MIKNTVNIENYYISNHAAGRMAQRNLTTEEVEFIIKNGRKTHCTGAIIYFLGKRDIPDSHLRNLSRLDGTAVIVYQKSVATVIRNTKYSKKIKHKPKWKRQKFEAAFNLAGN